MKKLILLAIIPLLLGCTNTSNTVTESAIESNIEKLDSTKKEFSPIGKWSRVFEIKGEYDKDDFTIALLKTLQIHLDFKRNGKLLMKSTLDGSKDMFEEFYWQYSNDTIFFNTSREISTGSSVLLKINDNKLELWNPELPKTYKQYFTRDTY